MVKNWLGVDQSGITMKTYEAFLTALVSGDAVSIQQHMNEYLYSTASYFDINKTSQEKLYHVMVLGMVMGLQDSYYTRSNRPGGIGRYDALLMPKDASRPGLVIEFKKASSQKGMQQAAEKALAQIEAKDYAKPLKERGIKKIQALGMVFHDKQVCIVAKDIVV